MSEIEFLLGLTRDEAVALVLLQQSRISRTGVVHEVIGAVGDALIEADEDLLDEQYLLFVDKGYPEYDLSDAPIADESEYEDEGSEDIEDDEFLFDDEG